jgi:hypothetical protein
MNVFEEMERGEGGVTFSFQTDTPPKNLHDDFINKPF